MKKIISFILIVTLVVVLLVGCKTIKENTEGNVQETTTLNSDETTAVLPERGGRLQGGG